MSSSLRNGASEGRAGRDECRTSQERAVAPLTRTDDSGELRARRGRTTADGLVVPQSRMNGGSSGATPGRPADGRRAIHGRTARTVAVFVVLVALGLVGFWLDINAGYQAYSLQDLWAVLRGTAAPGLIYTFVQLRLPRVLCSLLVGVGLALSGCILQGISRNEMAEPGILGINAGAGLLIALFIWLVPASGLSLTLVLPLLAFVGSVAVALLDWRFSVVRGVASPRRLLLVGVAMSTGLASVTSIVMLRLPDSDYAFVQNWLAGNIWGATWPNVAMLAVVLAVLLLAALYKARTLNVMALGPLLATGVGVSVKCQTRLLLALAVGASSVCCAVGGGLSFAGLVCPHMARRLVGPDFRRLLPATVLVGADLMLFADVISRTLLLPVEIPVGIVVAVIGAPYFLYLLAKS